MTMQRKHYNAIAAALRSGHASTQLIADITSSLARDNFRFDRGKFELKAYEGPTMEQRAAKYRSHIRSMDRWRADHP